LDQQQDGLRHLMAQAMLVGAQHKSDALTL